MWQRDRADFKVIAEQLNRLRPLARAEAAMRPRISPSTVKEAISNSGWKQAKLWTRSLSGC